VAVPGTANGAPTSLGEAHWLSRSASARTSTSISIKAATELLLPPLHPHTWRNTHIYPGDTPPVVIPTLRRDGRAYLRTHHVTAVVAGPEPHRRRAVEFVSAVLMQAPVTSGGVEIWRLGGRRGPGLPVAVLSAIWHSSVARIK